MTDEIVNRLKNLAFSAPQMTSSTLKSLLIPFLRDFKSMRQGLGEDKTGRMSLQSLQKQGCRIENIEISENNIADFKHVARKYGVDFALKKITDPDGESHETVFFKAKDANTMKRALSEYAGLSIRDQNREDQTEKKTLDEQIRDAREENEQEKERPGMTRERTRSTDRSVPPL